MTTKRQCLTSAKNVEKNSLVRFIDTAVFALNLATSPTCENGRKLTIKHRKISSQFINL